MVAVQFQATRFTMEQTFRQLQFDNGSLTALRTRLTRMLRGHLMEMFTIAFRYPTAPVKEHAPRCVGNGLGEVSIFYHIAGFELLRNNRIKTFVVKKVIGGFRQKVKPLTGNNIRLLRQRVFCLVPPFTLIRLSRQVAVKFDEFTFRLPVKAGVRYLLAIRSRQKIVCANVHTTSRLRNTFQRIRHFANDKAIPPPRRLFQRDLFRVSNEATVLADLDFT